MATANLAKENLTRSVKDGQTIYSLVQEWKVQDANTPAEALIADNLPPSNAVTQVGGIFLNQTSASARQTYGPNKKTYFDLTINWSNDTTQFEGGQSGGVPPVDDNGDPVTDPTKSAKQVQITIRKKAELIEDAKLLWLYQWDPAGNISWVGIPPYMVNLTRKGPVLNSALVDQQVTRNRSLKQVSVSKVYKTWDATWDDFLDLVNDDDVTLKQRDSAGTRFEYDFSAGTLLMEDIVKEDLWIDFQGKRRLFFKVTFVMLYDPQGWTHEMVDQGNVMHVFSGQYKLDNANLWTAAEVADNGGRWAQISTDFQEYASGSSVPLNGSGVPLWIQNIPGGGPVNPDWGPVHLEYVIYTSTPFTPLNIWS